MSEPPAQRYKVTLVDRVQFYRRPRSKKRRILKKWRARPENYRPLMVPIGHTIIMGSMAMGAKRDSSAVPSPYWSDENPYTPRILEMHTKLWEKILADRPDFAAKCDLFRQVETVRDGVRFIDEVPV